MEKSDELFTEPPRIQKIDVLASKLPLAAPAEPTTKALLLTFKAKDGNEPEVEQFLRDAQPLVMEEADTAAWFGIHLENGDYGIFDVFPDNNGRFKHLAGHVPRELLKHSLTILGSVPDMEFPSVLAEKLGEYSRATSHSSAETLPFTCRLLERHRGTLSNIQIGIRGSLNLRDTCRDNLRRLTC